MIPRKSVLIAALLCSAFLAAAASAQMRAYTVYRTPVAPKIDGVFDDPCWRTALWQPGLRMLGGGTISLATQTQFAMVWDLQNLYIAIRCKEPAMVNLVTRAGDGDNSMWSDDHVELFLAPENHREDYYQFAINSNNKKIDLTYESSREISRMGVANSGRWVTAVRREASSWNVEMAIPLSVAKLEAREGLSFVGNVARTRLANLDAELDSTWAPLKSGFNEPFGFASLKLAGLPPPIPVQPASAPAAASALPPAIADEPADVKPPPPKSFDRYQVVVLKNIFLRDHRSPVQPLSSSVSTPASDIPSLSPEEATVLRGVVHQGEGPDAVTYIFLEDIRTQATTRMQVGDLVCAGKFAGATSDSVEYARPDAAPLHIEVGMNLTGAVPATPAPASTDLVAPVTRPAPAPATPVATPGPWGAPTVAPAVVAAPAPAPGPVLSDSAIMQQLRLRRQRDLGR